MDSPEDNSPAQNFVPVCAIGASAGGVASLRSLFRLLPTDLGLAYVVILHLNPDEPSVLDEILSICTRMPVHQVKDGPPLKPNCVYVIPPDRELVIDGDNVTARPFTEKRGQRAPIDMFFRSVAAGRGDGVAIVLSGAGSDGALGVSAMKEAGGIILAQEPAEAAFPQMPQSAIATGMVDFVGPIARLAERLVEVAHSKEAVRSLDMDGAANDLRRIVALLRARTGHDFSSYKRATVTRRVLRRMQVCGTPTLADYADHLLTTPDEAQNLFEDLLISVTMFFRDEAAFEALARQAIKPIVETATTEGDETIRVWVVGCATGEEAYSIAILLQEELARQRTTVPFQIFATDLDEAALATAREARYPHSIAADVSDDRLHRFFVDDGNYFRIRKELRESVLFAKHSVLKDPPFMRLDLISCRNLLIYLERALQAQICSIFHYGLRPGRYLFLGSAETVDAAADLFAPVDRHARIYSSRPHAVHLLPILPQFAAPEQIAGRKRPEPAGTERAALPAALHVAALENAAPASALVDDEQNILHLSPTAGRFLVHPAGPVSKSLPVVVRPELSTELRVALARALEQQKHSVTLPTVVAFEQGRRRVAMHVVPVNGEAQKSPQALVFFLDGDEVANGNEGEALPDTHPEDIRRLYAELKASQEALIVSRSGHDASIQELRASNEELQSINEEYRSTAEELETSKEELQSINEELHTVNAELKSKLESISAAHSDLQNLTDATEIGTLFLGPDLRIKMFTPPIAELFSITRLDVGRVITDFTNQLDYHGIEEDARRVLTNLAPIEREVGSKRGRRYVVRLRPYRTVDDRIDGTVLTFVDISERAQAEAAMRESERKYRTLFDSIDEGFCTIELIHDAAGRPTDYRLIEVNQAFERQTGMANAAGKLRTEVAPGNEDEWLKLYDEVARTGTSQRVQDYHEPTERWYDVYVAPVASSVPWRLSVIFNDITDRKRAELALRASEERLRQFGEASQDILWIRNAETLQWQYLTPAFEKIYGLSRAEVLEGDNYRSWLDLIVPEDRERAAESIARVRNGEHVTFHYRIRRPADGTIRWLRNTDFPILVGDGSAPLIGGIGHDFTLVRETEQQLQTLMEGIPQLVWRSRSDGLWTWSSPQWQAFTGQTQEQSRGRGWLDAVHQDDRVAAMQAWDMAAQRGGLDAEYRVRRASDGAWLWHHSRSLPVRDEDGRIVEWLGTTTDVQQLKELQGHQAVLVEELQHRTRNLIAVVRAISDRTARSSTDLPSFRERFSDRLDALGRVQGLLSRLHDGERVTFDTFIRSEISAVAGSDERATLEGPSDVRLRSSTLQTLALALHELATNAMKYGALRQPSGRLAIRWSLEPSTEDGTPWLHIDWRESGVTMPSTGPPVGTGQGRQLIERALPYQLKAKTTYAFGDDGVHCTISVPVSASNEAAEDND